MEGTYKAYSQGKSSIFNNNSFPRGLVIKREVIDEKYNVKILNLISSERFTIASEILNNTIVYE